MSLICMSLNVVERNLNQITENILEIDVYLLVISLISCIHVLNGTPPPFFFSKTNTRSLIYIEWVGLVHVPVPWWAAWFVQTAGSHTGLWPPRTERDRTGRGWGCRPGSPESGGTGRSKCGKRWPSVGSPALVQYYKEIMHLNFNFQHDLYLYHFIFWYYCTKKHKFSATLRPHDQKWIINAMNYHVKPCIQHSLYMLLPALYLSILTSGICDLGPLSPPHQPGLGHVGGSGGELRGPRGTPAGWGQRWWPRTPAGPSGKTSPSLTWGRKNETLCIYSCNIS